MTDQQALLRAVLREPEDDNVRLVYADYLQENGEAERAEFIGVQIALAKNPVCPAAIYHPRFDAPDHGDKMYVYPPPAAPKKPCGWCPVCVNRKREYELWQKHFPTQADWDLPLGNLRYAWQVTSRPETIVNAPTAILRRGFVEQIRIAKVELLGGTCGNCDKCVAHHVSRINNYCSAPGVARELFKAHPIQKVVLSDRTPRNLSEKGDWWAWGSHKVPSYESAGGTCTLPKEIYGLLPDNSPGRDFWTSGYGSRLAALEALSVACVRYGRGLSGLTDEA